MKQVRELAHDCRNCIDLYLLHGDPAIHRARGGLKGQFWRAYWFVQEVIAKNKAAIRLRELKERAGDVGKRRLRYGVEIPGKPAPGGGAGGAGGASSSTLMLPPFSSSSQGAATLPAAAEHDDDEEDGDVQHQTRLATENYSHYRQLALLPPTLDDYFLEKISNRVMARPNTSDKEERESKRQMRSIAIVAPEESDDTIVNEGLAKARARFDRTIWINMPLVHYSSDKLGPNKVLFYILRVCRLQKEHNDNKWKENRNVRFIAWSSGRAEKSKIRQEFEAKVDGRIEELENKIEDMGSKISSKAGESNKNEAAERGNKIIEVDFDGKIKELENKIKDLESKINEKTGMGNVPGAGGTNGGNKKNEETQGEDKIVYKTGESIKNEATTQGGKKAIEQTSGSNTNEGEAAQGVNKVCVPEQTSGSNANEGQATQGINKILIPEQTSGSNTAREPDGSLLFQTDKPIGVLYLALLSLCQNEKKDQDIKDVLESDEHNVIQKTAIMLAKYMASTGMNLEDTQCENILQELFQTGNSLEAQEATSGATSNNRAAAALLGNDQTREIMDQIKQVICMVKQDIQADIQCTPKSHGQGGKYLGQDQIAKAIHDTKNKIPKIKTKIKEQMMIKGIVDKINEHLDDKDKLLIILQDENRRRGPKWDNIMNALKLLNCAKGSVVLVTTKESEKANEFCYPRMDEDPITYSLVGLYHDLVLKLTEKMVKNKDQNSSQIFRSILDKCHPHEFSMKMFAGALYANPNRSCEELQKLCESLQDQRSTLAIINNAKKIFKFSYRDLPREHKTCLLYLAVFPQGDNIRRSTLIGRWLTEGLITKEDWTTAVRHADRCFDALIDRCLVYPCDISAKGEFKSCMVGDVVHGFITKMAKKQHILDARLSYLLARHFSIFSGLRLRASDTIDNFVQKLDSYCSPQLSLLRLLDLQGCRCFDKKSNYLKAIFKNISFLKYLSLRKTNIIHLPREINNLHDLEILDIRQTRVPVNETRHVLLLKLRRLLAGDTDPSASSYGIHTTNGKQKSVCSYVSIPYKIEKMENLEVLSNVMASLPGKELKDISKLWQLRKLGVVINDNKPNILSLLGAVADLKECLQSISITIPETRGNEPFGSTDEKILPDKIYSRLVQPSKGLESVSINGCTRSLRILSLLSKGSSELAKVALCGTLLNQEDLNVLDSLPKLLCIRLRHHAYDGLQFIFNKGEFEHLKFLLVDGYNMNNINFMKGAAVALEKIVLSSTNIKSLDGAGHLPMLKALELIGNELLDSISGEASTGKSTETESPSEDRAPPQRKTQLVSFPEVRTAPEKNTQLVSPPAVGSASQENTQLITHHEDDAVPQKNIVPTCEVGEALQKNTERNITFKKEEFQHLKYFCFEDSEMINIILEDGAAPELEKIILRMTGKESKVAVSGNLPKLREIEVKGDKSIFLPLVYNANKANKVTLCDTLLSKDADLYKHLSAKQSLCCLVLLDNSYDEMLLSFDKDGFSNLNLLIIKCSKIRIIHFNSGSCPKLEKIIWFYNECDPPNEIQISGMDNIGKLKELELNGDNVPRQLRNCIRAHKNKPVLTHKIPEHEDDEKHGKQQGDAPCFPRFSTSYFSKKKDQQ